MTTTPTQSFFLHNINSIPPPLIRYPFLSSEIIACEIQQIIDVIVVEHKDELLNEFWKYLDRPAHPKRRASFVGSPDEVGLDSLQASYFCKTIGVLLSKYPVEVKGGLTF